MKERIGSGVTAPHVIVQTLAHDRIGDGWSQESGIVIPGIASSRAQADDADALLPANSASRTTRTPCKTRRGIAVALPQAAATSQRFPALMRPGSSALALQQVGRIQPEQRDVVPDSRPLAGHESVALG